MNAPRTIVAIGEALFDVFPDEYHLGGATLNVAVHAKQLGNDARLVARIGQDRLGDELIARLKDFELPVDDIQFDPDRPTGEVRVDFDASGEPSYDIVEPVAWDYLRYDPTLDPLARTAEAVCFGTLGQRNSLSRSTIQRFIYAAKSAIRLCDLNLRGEPDRNIIQRSLELATAAKLNAGELAIIGGLFRLTGESDADRARDLIKRFHLDFVALTRGADGLIVYTADAEHAAQSAPIPASLADPVGAGDATTAAILHGLTRRWPWPRTIELANRLGAFVVSQPGACPALNDEILELAGVEKEK